jgi:leader peptidase (prepilin peptidase)/N-methyltransferase
MPRPGPAATATALAVCLGLLIANVMLRLGLLRPSFLEADADRPGADTVAITKAHGVDPRKEILRELLFLAPALLLGLAAFLAITYVPTARELMKKLIDAKTPFGLHVSSAMGAVLGMLAGIAWLWGTRIFGTLLFGKEAMGMGDVHIMAAIGAVAGWEVATLTFFAAPVFGLFYAMYLLAFKGKRELPYGPWLAFAALFVLVFYDAILMVLIPGSRY